MTTSVHFYFTSVPFYVAPWIELKFVSKGIPLDERFRVAWGQATRRRVVCFQEATFAKPRVGGHPSKVCVPSSCWESNGLQLTRQS